MQQRGTGSEPGNCPSKDPKLDTKNGETVKSTPPTTSGNNTVAANKRKREFMVATTNYDKETKSANVIPIANTTETSEKHISTTETTGAKEVEMKEAETVYTKEVEMQDAEAVHSKTSLEENSFEESTVVREEEKTQLNTNKNDVGSNSDTTEQPIKVKVDESEGNEKRSIDANTSDESGQQVLGEVATLLKQLQESDAKAKLEVEVKVRKMDHGDVKENGEANETQNVDRLVILDRSLSFGRLLYVLCIKVVK